MLYTSFISGSRNYLEWLSEMITKLYALEGKIGIVDRSSYQLRFAKRNSILLLAKMYYKEDIPCLARKRSKILKSLGIIHQQAGVLKLVDKQS